MMTDEPNHEFWFDTPLTQGGAKSPEGGRNVRTTDLASDEESSTATPSTTKGTPNSHCSRSREQPDGMPQGGGVDGEVLRNEDPHYNTWKVTDLRAKALEITKIDGAKALVFGPHTEEDCLASWSSATKTALVKALLKRARWRESTGKPQDYQHWGPITPKKAAKARARPSKHTGVRKDAASVCRMVCLTAEPRILHLYDKANQEPNRDEQDAREIGAQHRFYKDLALNLIDEGYTTSDGNPKSIPVSHSSDNPEAPPSLHDALDSIDLVAPAEVVKSGLFGTDDGKLELLPLQNALFKWVKALRASHTELRIRVDKSGGVGADVVEGGDHDGDVDGDDGSAEDAGGGDGEAAPQKRKGPQRRKDATHTWEFILPGEFVRAPLGRPQPSYGRQRGRDDGTNLRQ